MNFDFVKHIAAGSKIRVDMDDLEAILNAQEDASLQSPGVDAHYYRFIYQLAKAIRPKTVLELGTHTGISSACFADGNPDATVYTVNNQNQLWDHCRRQNVKYILQDSLIPVHTEDLIDILFIDTDHDGIRCGQEFNLYLPRMKNNGIILFDDIGLNVEMKMFWNSFNPGYVKHELPVHGWAGFGVIIINDESKTAKGN